MKTKNNIEKLIEKVLEESLSKGDSPITEATLSKAQLDKREDIIKDLKKNKKELVKRYGKDAEAVMYGRATNLAKKAVTEMNKEKLKELVRKSLMNEADIEAMADKIGGEDELSLASNLLDDFESKLKSHDWFYMMSDDNRAYTKGSAEESELKKLAKQLDSMGYGDDAAKVYNQYNKFDKVSFESYVTPPQPFIPMYKRKQMGLDETEFSKEFDNDSTLKGGQKKLPDALQKAIIKKEKGIKEGYYGTTNVESYVDVLGYESFKDFFNDNPGAETALINWIESISEFRNKLMDSGMLEEDIDLGHVDNEPHMIKGELYQIGKYAMDLYQMMDSVEGKGEVDLPAWWQSKVTTAKNMMSGAKHYLDFEMKEPEIDAIVKVASDEDILDENIGKDEILAGRLYKIKNFVQPAFYQKVRNLINSGDLETAELFISRMEPAAAKNDMEMAKMKGDLEDMDRVAAQRQREKQIANIFVREGKKLTKDELKEIIKATHEGIDEGFFDRLTANIKGITAKTSTTFDNLKAFTRGDKEAIKDPKLAQNMAKLQQKAKTLDSQLTNAMKDMATLFPKDVIAKTPEEFQTILSQYTQLLDKAKVLNTQISTGNYKPSSTTSTKAAPPTAAKPPTTATPPTAATPPTTATPPAAKPPTTATPPTAAKPPTTATPPNPKQPQARDAKGRFVSTKKVAELLAKKLKETF